MAIETNVIGTTDLVKSKEKEANEILDKEKIERELSLDALAGHIMTVFRENRDARRSSGVEKKLLDSARAYNGEYNQNDKALILQEGGADIFMNITATKCRAAKAWIMDILTPANEKAWMLSPSPMPELPEEMTRQIEEALAREFEEANKPQEEAQPQEQPQQEEAFAVGAGRQAPQQGSIAKQAQRSIHELNRDRREMKEAAMEEIDTEAKFQVKVQERQIHDQLVEGNWDQAFDDFIQNFVVFQAAFMKGPIVTKKPKLTWVDGEVQVIQKIHYINKAVSPYDIYPSGEATSIQEGDLLEHTRYSAKELQNLRGVPGYSTERINEVLQKQQTGKAWLDDYIEDEKNDLEQRGDEYEVNKNVIHGLHFFGCVKAQLLRAWGMTGLDNIPDGEVVEVEAILAGDEVIKVQKNQDPLQRRPYYKASYVNIPGSFWGRSLPEMMSPTQRMCNATARALATNMGMASGPQVEIYVDRLADSADISALYPRKIWQMKSDSGNQSGRGVTFFNVPSNAKELLEVYREFESRADDVTGIPRYAYGSDPKAVGASTTATGLSMMLESATKIVKDAIRSVDNGLIKPRIEYQFYQNILANDIKYTGDIHVIPKGSATLTIKAAQNIRRNEYLQITANQNDQEAMGPEARVAVIREIGKELGLDGGEIPSSFKVRQMMEEKAKREAENRPPDYGLEVAKMQTESAERVSQMNAQIKQQSEQMKMQMEQMKMQQKQASDQAKLQVQMQKDQGELMVRMEELRASMDKQTQEIAVKLKQGSGI